MRILLAALLTVFGVSTADAAPQTLECKMTKLGQSGGWIPPLLSIKYDPETGAVDFVNDDRRLGAKDKRGTKISIDNKKRITFSWKASDTRSRSRQHVGTFAYRATYFKKNGKMNVYAKPVGYANDFTARGACKKR